MMKSLLIAVVAVLILGACTGTRYYPVERPGAGRYYVGDSPARIVHYSRAEASLFAYGLSPWWGYGYYSPSFYPYYFDVSYGSWPYYSPWPYYSYWYGSRSFWYAPYRYHQYRHPGHRPGHAMAVAPPAGFGGPPAGVPVRGGERLRVMDDRGGARREPQAVRPSNSQAAGRMAVPASPTASGPRGRSSGSWGAPAAPAAGGTFPARGEAAPGPVSRRHPRRHDQ